MLNKAKSFLLVVVLFLAVVPDATAMPRTSRTSCGQIVAYDKASQTFEFKPDNGKSLSMKMAGTPRGIRDGKFADLSSVEVGARACSTYRRPLFGPLRLIRVRWETKSPGG